MQLPDADPMTPAEFKDLLSMAVCGGFISDTGAPQGVDEALMAIMKAYPDPSDDSIQAARTAFERSRL